MLGDFCPDEGDCEMPFWVDTDGYSDRDRLMFVCGVEFEMVYRAIKNGWRGCRETPIQSENESRIRLMCGRLGLKCECLPCEGERGYSHLKVWESNTENADY